MPFRQMFRHPILGRPAEAALLRRWETGCLLFRVQTGQKVSPQGTLIRHPAVHPGRSEGRSVTGRIGSIGPTREGADFLCSS